MEDANKPDSQDAVCPQGVKPINVTRPVKSAIAGSIPAPDPHYCDLSDDLYPLSADVEYDGYELPCNDWYAHYYTREGE